MKRNSLKYLILTCFYGLPLSLFSQSIWSNPITGANPNTNNPYTAGQTVNSNLTVSGIGRGSGIAGSNANDRYNATGWNTSAFDPSAYFTFTITPKSGYEIDFNSFTYTAQASGTGPLSFSFRTSVDGFATDIFAATSTGGTLNLSSFQNISTAIEFRLYGWSASSVAGSYSVNDFAFNGTLSLTCFPPTTQSYMLAFSNPTTTSMDVSWTNGNGTNRVVKINTSNSFTDPSGDPAANPVYGGSGELVIYNGTGNSVSVSGLSASTTYHFRVYEYNVCYGTNTYNTNSATNNPKSQSTTSAGPLITYFRSRQTGNWNDMNTWETATTSDFSTTITSPATSTPDNTSGAITIISPHVVTVAANVTTDETTVNSGGSLVVDPNVVLTVNNGTGDDITVSSGSTMTIKSIATGTGSIGNSTGNIVGNVTVERYISSASNRAYRLLGPSVNTSGSTKPFIRDNWQEGVNNPNTGTNLNPVPDYGTHITGSTVGANGFDATQTGQASLYTFNQPSQMWESAANTTATPLAGNTGYLLYIRSDRSIDLNSTSSPSLPSTNTTLRATGEVLMNQQNYAVLANSGNFGLITNPYPSAINWSTIYGNNSSGFVNYYTYWDPNIGTRGGYVTVTNTGVVSPDPAITPTPSPAGTINIQSGQAFFVKPITGVTERILTIDETDKSSTNNIDVFRTSSPAASTFTASLYFNSAEHGRRLADGVTALYDPFYNKAFDGNDAEEINNWDENIAISRDGKHLSIEERPSLTAKDTIFLSMNNMKQQGYEFDFNPTNLNPNMTAQLVDSYTGIKTVLNIISKTTVPFTVTADASSSASNRFYIAFSPSGALPVSLINLKAFQKNTGVQVEWTTQQEINMERYEVERSQTGQSFTQVGSIQAKSNSSLVNNYNLFDANPFSGINYYKIKTIDKAGIVTYSQVVKVNVNKASSTITLLSNPVKNNSVDLQFNNMPRGVYIIELTNELGQQIARKIFNHNGGSVKETIKPANGFASGIYQLKVSGAQMNISHQVIKN